MFKIIVPHTTIGTAKSDALEQMSGWLEAQAREGWEALSPVVVGTTARATISSTHPEGLLILRQTTPPKGSK